jgi:hypothetical protein
LSKRRKKHRHAKLLEVPSTRATSRWAGTIGAAAAIALALGVGVWAFNFAPMSGAAKPVADGAASDSAFEKLKGRWQRPDGGYVLAINSIAGSGAIDASYYNPNPIHVAKAKAKREGATLQVFVELRAPNYPGSTYTLTYDQEQDQLRGDYFQAVERQNFKVLFVRMK